MPDSRRGRGPHPKDEKDFREDQFKKLTRATDDLCFLRSRGYAHKASLELVGNRYKLRERQRKALQRCVASDQEIEDRFAKQIAPSDMAGETLWIDGYNVLLTIEAALSGGLLLRARDGLTRDLAALSRHYRKVGVTQPALEAIGRSLEALGVTHTRWLLDRPISNSARLANLIRKVGEQNGWSFVAELVANPDRQLIDTHHIVATADSGILDRCRRFFNLARHVVEQHAPNAWQLEP